MLFRDRIDAGKKLTKKLIKYKNNPNVIVLGMPRGGVVCADIVADFLNAPLDLLITRKIGAPENPEYAIGAIAEGENLMVNEAMANQIASKYLENEIKRQKKIINLRIRKYHLKRPLELFDKIVILIDDGLATGYTAKAAILAIREQNPQKIILAIPILPKSTLFEIEGQVDEIVFLDAPEYFFAVGQFYDNFDQVTDDEVKEIIDGHKA